MFAAFRLCQMLDLNAKNSEVQKIASFQMKEPAVKSKIASVINLKNMRLSCKTVITIIYK